MDLILTFRILNDNTKILKTTIFELNFLICLFSEASLFPLSDCYSSEFILEFVKFYFYQSFEDKSVNVKLKQNDVDVRINNINKRLEKKMHDLSNDMHQLANVIDDTSKNDIDVNALQCYTNPLILSLFMPFVFFFDKKEKKIVHWPVAGPNLNIRKIKHEKIIQMNDSIMRNDYNGESETSYGVPFKIDYKTESSDDATQNVDCLFTDHCPEKPEFKNLCAAQLSLQDFQDFFQLFL